MVSAAFLDPVGADQLLEVASRNEPFLLHQPENPRDLPSSRTAEAVEKALNRTFVRSRPVEDNYPPHAGKLAY